MPKTFGLNCLPDKNYVKQRGRNISPWLVIIEWVIDLQVQNIPIVGINETVEAIKYIIDPKSRECLEDLKFIMRAFQSLLKIKLSPAKFQNDIQNSPLTLAFAIFNFMKYCRTMKYIIFWCLIVWIGWK